ncbi:MAG: hypothetical protein KAG82_00630 [Alcanivoracaceae bacterium]|nr:hypothetical protein [Alcanivoracaceae bacterium]
MRSFIFGAIGAILVLAIGLATIPLYSDYAARSISHEMLLSVEPLQEEISERLQSGQSIEPGISESYTNTIQYLEKKSDGTLIIKASGAGQILVLIPFNVGEGVAWKCIGGPDSDVPALCRGT